MTSQEPERREGQAPFLGSDAPAVRAKVVVARAEAARREMELRRRQELWLHHLGTLNLERAYKAPRWLDGMAGRLARARAEVDGKTFAEIAELDSALQTDGLVDVGAWGPWRIELEKDGEEA